MQRILIVEDDIIIGGGVKLFLESKGFICKCVNTAAEARAALAEAYSLVLLDITLPDGNGLELCREIREKSRTPIIFLTANDTEEQMIEGFQQGCDDYIAKPFSVELLYRRIVAVMRRSQSAGTGDVFAYGGLSVDMARMQAMKNGEAIKLSAMEYKLLELLIRNKGQVLTRELILERLWDCNGNYVDENTLRVLIRRLRQKIENDPKDPKLIVTVFGIGYTFGEQ